MHRRTLRRPRRPRRLTPLLLTAALAAFALAPSATAQDAKELGWSDTAELSFVATGGNSEATTLGFKNQLRRVWQDALFKLDAGGVRAESTTTTTRAVGTPGDFDLVEDSDSELTAENYFLKGRYEKNLTERFFWFVGAGWERNEFAGIENRYSASGGVGHTWFDTETSRFATDYAVTYTRQEDVVEDPSGSEGFLGLRLGWDWRRQLTETTEYTNALTVDENLDETDDLRADMTQSLAVNMTQRLAIKLSLQLLYDNQPSLEAVPLESPAGTPTGETVLVELDELDTQLTAALVITL